MYKITAIDPFTGKAIRLELTRQEACTMVGNAILQGVIASSEIEGESPGPMHLKEPVNLPENVLCTPVARPL